MKATELMIGDFIFVNGKITKVENIFNNYINYCQDIPYVQEENYVKEDDIEPIPLTAEIIEKNGFELQEQEPEQDFIHGIYRLKHELIYLEPYSSNIKEGYGIGCSIIDYKHFNVQYRVLLKFGKIYSVHELQHALRTCGLNDLADNFKI